MRSQEYKHPEFFIKKAQEFTLSGNALLDLMQSVLAKGKDFRFCAHGWSMTPFIKNGDIVTVTPIIKTPGFGDVVAFIHPNYRKLVIHRVIDKQGSDFLIRGDSIIEGSNELIPRELILGRVIKIERKGRQIWIGLGPERGAIAWFSRNGCLVRFVNKISFLIHKVKV